MNISGSIEMLIVFIVKPFAVEQKENGVQSLQSFFGCLLDDCSVGCSSSHLSNMEQGTRALNKM
jgi:hypothetical protein